MLLCFFKPAGKPMLSGLCLRPSKIAVQIFSGWLMPYQRCILKEAKKSGCWMLCS